MNVSSTSAKPTQKVVANESATNCRPRSISAGGT